MPASDLWQLGVIMYLMHCGKVPFEATDLSVPQRILSLDFEWPKDQEVSSEAKDLVERLLKLNPRERLGAGEPESPNNLN